MVGVRMLLFWSTLCDYQRADMGHRVRRPRHPRAPRRRPPFVGINRLKNNQPWFRLAGPAFGAILATAAASCAMALVRTTMQVRTVPERLLEWLLLFLPPAQLEAGLQRFGFDAKRYALYAVTAASLVVLAAVGSVVLIRGWRAQQMLALGIALWLLIMGVIMPLTGAGWMAGDLLSGTWNAALGYLAVALAYVGALGLASTFSFASGPQRLTGYPIAGRRAAIVSLGSALAALVTIRLIKLVDVRPSLTEVPVFDPEGPPNDPDLPANHPELVNQRAADELTPAETVQPPASAQPPSAPQLAEPRQSRPFKRDKDGAILPSGRRKGELTDLITSNDDFYVVTKNAAGDPLLRATNWTLRLDGDVERPIELNYASLRNLPGVEVTQTLECISNFAAKCELAAFGCDLISTARWKGVRLATLLELAGGANPDARFLAVIAADEYTSALPIEAVSDPSSVLVYEMNGEVLPREHGYPARLLVPGRYGMKNTKWVIGLRLMRREFVDWYGQRNWSREALVKTMTRIDLPPAGSQLPSGEYNVAGIAYAGARGIAMVEFSLNDGKTWLNADLVEPPIANDAWVRWIGRFSLAPGQRATVRSRAIDGTGALQEQEFSLPEPAGSSGWPSIEITAQGG